MIPVVEKIIDLKERKGLFYEGETRESLREHYGKHLKQLEVAFGGGGEVIAYMEWYIGKPIYEKGKLLGINRGFTDHLFIANVSSQSLHQILKLGRKILRLNPEIQWICGHHRKWGKEFEIKVKKEWRLA